MARTTQISEVKHYPHFDFTEGLEDKHCRMSRCFAWNLKFVQGMTYKQCAAVLGVSETEARREALRYETRFTYEHLKQDYRDRELENDIAKGLFVWKPLIFSEAMALHKSLNPC